MDPPFFKLFYVAVKPLLCLCFPPLDPCPLWPNLLAFSYYFTINKINDYLALSFSLIDTEHIVHHLTKEDIIDSFTSFYSILVGRDISKCTFSKEAFEKIIGDFMERLLWCLGLKIRFRFIFSFSLAIKVIGSKSLWRIPTF